MRILIAPDKFKDSLGAREVAEAIAAGIRDVLPDAEIILQPMADGGEGTAEVICGATGGEWHECEVHDAIGEVVTARYGTMKNGATVVMEMSEASGLWRLRKQDRDPLIASSFGTGEMLLAAARRGAREIIIGLGGSATNDGGVGMARALGFRFLDKDCEELARAVNHLLQLDRIEWPNEPSLPRIIAAVDVQNRLLGARGATRVFAAQKGATGEQVELLERALTRLADVVARDLGVDCRHVAGSGAAGGLGFGLTSFCSAELRPGFDLVAKTIGLDEAVRKADVIITGEGKFDPQSMEGKAPIGVARLARKHKKRCFAIVGQKDATTEPAGLFESVALLADGEVTASMAMGNTADLLRLRADELARHFRHA